ncbi:MAG: hypothetical protein ABIJ84_00100 [bacterium]
MIELFFLIVFILSLGGALFILARKAPALVALSKNGRTGLRKHKLISEAESKINKLLSFFSDGVLLHKFLSWSKCRVIKIETWIDSILHGIRKKAKEDKLNGKK